MQEVSKDEAQALGCPDGDRFTKLFGESETLFAVQFEAYGAGTAPCLVGLVSGHSQVVQGGAAPKPREQAPAARVLCPGVLETEDLPRLPLSEAAARQCLAGRAA